MKKKIYTILSCLVIFILWLVPYLAIQKGEDYVTYESVGVILVGVAILITCTFIQDLYYPLVLFCYVPFVFSHSFTTDTTPICLYIAGGIAILGFIIHFIRYRTKLKRGNLFNGLTAFAISFILGGIGNKENEYLVLQLVTCTLIGVSFVLIYTLFVSYNTKREFTEIVDIINGLALIIIAQCAVYYKLNPTGINAKTLAIGWAANGNSISMILLLCMPFSFYRFAFSNRKFDFLYLFFFFLTMATIVISYSRGAILFGGIGFIVMILISIFYQKKYCFKTIVPIIFIVTIGYIVLRGNEVLYNSIIENTIKRINLDTGNGRFVIYKDLFEKSFDHKIFGHGLLYPLMYNSYTGGYQWGHNTFLHTFFTLGFVGVVSLAYHMFEKYYGVIRHIDKNKITLLMAYLISGLYGLIDVSYFFINYMVVIIIIFCLSEEFSERILFKKKEK